MSDASDPVRRHYGTDTTPDHHTLVELAVQPDGTRHYTAVTIDRHPQPTTEQE